MNDHLQLPYQDIVGESSPVQQALRCFRAIAKEMPMPNANTEQSRSAAALILTHLLGLCDGTGLINCRGYHSAAITLFRPIEDATDCLAAVSLDAKAAKNWSVGSLKSSDAAKIWTSISRVNLSTEIHPSEYRRIIRSALNNYSHCTSIQAHWNVYIKSTGEKKCTTELNTIPLVINSNSYYIDRYLCAHIYELIEVFFIVFSNYFASDSALKEQLEMLKTEIVEVVDDFLAFITNNKIDISAPPELLPISLDYPHESEV